MTEKNIQYYKHSNKQQSYRTVAKHYCIFNQPTIVQTVFPNTDHSLFISNQLQIALKLLFIVQCNFVDKTVRTLNKLRSSKVVLSGYFREFLHAGSGKYTGKQVPCTKNQIFTNLLRANNRVQTKRKSKAKTGKQRICIPVYFNMGVVNS